MTTKQPKSEPPQPPEAIPGHADDWIRQCVKHFELNLVDATRRIELDAEDPDLQMAAARAFLATLIDSGLQPDSALELLGRAALERSSIDLAWDDVLNQRRFALIDKEIQGTLTPAESTELAGLTRIMREHVEGEANLPMEGAKALHRKLLRLKPQGESD